MSVSVTRIVPPNSIPSSEAEAGSSSRAEPRPDVLTASANGCAAKRPSVIGESVAVAVIDTLPVGFVMLRSSSPADREILPTAREASGTETAMPDPSMVLKRSPASMKKLAPRSLRERSIPNRTSAVTSALTVIPIPPPASSVMPRPDRLASRSNPALVIFGRPKATSKENRPGCCSLPRYGLNALIADPAAPMAAWRPCRVGCGVVAR